jgi:hypothetical protein
MESCDMKLAFLCMKRSARVLKELFIKASSFRLSIIDVEICQCFYAPQ